MVVRRLPERNTSGLVSNSLPGVFRLFWNFSRRNVSHSSMTLNFHTSLFHPFYHPTLLVVVVVVRFWNRLDVFGMLVKHHPKSCHSLANESILTIVILLTILSLRNGDVCYFCFGQCSTLPTENTRYHLTKYDDEDEWISNAMIRLLSNEYHPALFVIHLVRNKSRVNVIASKTFIKYRPIFGSISLSLCL